MTTSQANPASMRPADDDHERIVAVGTDRREEAITRLLAADGNPDDEHTRRFLQFAQAHAVSLDHLWGVVDRRNRFAAAVLAVPNAGRSAMFFASSSKTALEVARTGRLLDFACERLTTAGLHLAQSLLDAHEHWATDAYLAGGFERLATLSYLERPLRSRLLPPKPRWPADVTVESCAKCSEEELIALLDATYEDTLDCPGLRGHRETADILDGHRAAGVFDPRLWTVLRVNDRPAGVLLLNPSADHTSVELVYVGIARAARGRGLGTLLLQHGLHLVAGRPERIMTLAVDEANAPALALYRRERFRPVLRRIAMIRPLRRR